MFHHFKFGLLKLLLKYKFIKWLKIEIIIFTVVTYFLNEKF